MVSGIDEIWSADLVDMQAFSKFNQNYKYLLTIIDIFSKFAWVVPLKDKTGASVMNAFDKVIKIRKPEKLWVDEGKEFYNNLFKQWLTKHNITMYHTHNEGKAVVIERFNRTFKNLMWKYFTAHNTNKYMNVLPDMIDHYNETKHSSIKMPPTDASKPENQGIVYFNLYNSKRKNVSGKYKVGDQVRVSKYKRHFEKGYTPNWTEEIFVIHKIIKTNPITYQVKDLNGENISGSFYEQELIPAKQSVFRIDKVIKRDYKKKRALIKWSGYSDDFNSWVPLKDLISL